MNNQDITRYEKLEPLSPVFRSEQQVIEIAREFGTPVFVYSEDILRENAKKALAFPNHFGLKVRYAMKANPNANILRIFDEEGIYIDASSEYEVERARRARIPAQNILLTSQKTPNDIEYTLRGGVEYNACSLSQLVNYGSSFRGSDVYIRINPGLGSGGTNKTNTGGPSSSFGIWYEEIPEVLNTLDNYRLNVSGIHTHIGSGSDPEIWKNAARLSLVIAEEFLKEGHKVTSLNLGGGYKVGRMLDEKSTDLQLCGEPVKELFEEFATRNGIKLNLEIEPGTFLVATSGAVISKIDDYKRTSKYKFLITDSGMTEVTRPSLYGAQHPISVVNEFESSSQEDFIVSGKCCESGDILTPAPGNPEGLRTRRLNSPSERALVVIGATGAYCSSMSTKNYNSYPEAPEVLIKRDGSVELIRRRQTLDQIIENEIII